MNGAMGKKRRGRERKKEGKKQERKRKRMEDIYFMVLLLVD